MKPEDLQKNFLKLLPSQVAHASLRVHVDQGETLSVRQDVVKPCKHWQDCGGHVTVTTPDGGIGYAATSQLDEQGLSRAVKKALEWAEHTAQHAIFPFHLQQHADSDGYYVSERLKPWTDLRFADRLSRVRELQAALKVDARIVDWQASLHFVEEKRYLFTSNKGATVQHHHLMFPQIRVVAHDQGETCERHEAFDHFVQGGIEAVDDLNLAEQGQQMAKQAIALLSAPQCPEDTRDLLIAPSQMYMQIHESIGHPLELDRILGDERNYAGTSFVTPDMFGEFQYGSALLNVVFDGSDPRQTASYGFDDAGHPVKKTYLIKDGKLLNPLGSHLSKQRAGLSDIDATANARANHWRRPALDRMANINIEAGDASLEEMIGQTERGLYLGSNRSWSIDDSRNKFQFGCQWGYLIENGKKTQLVKNPNYRGISSEFWRKLVRVGNPATVATFGNPFCGKAEPNQAIRVGHKSPACLFKDIAVFGGV